jgi:adenylate cyclase
LATGRVERRLAAILAADVAGYSRLMGAEEEGTPRRIEGDPPRARRCAVEVQHEMAGRNAGVPPERRIEFRMGINVGDIVRDGRDIYGDGEPHPLAFRDRPQFELYVQR